MIEKQPSKILLHPDHQACARHNLDLLSCQPLELPCHIVSFMATPLSEAEIEEVFLHKQARIPMVSYEPTIGSSCLS